MMRINYQLKNLDCANCAAKIERAVGKIDGVQTANVDFMNTKMSLTCPSDQAERIAKEATLIVHKLEPDVKVISEEQVVKEEHSHGDSDNKTTIVRIVIAAFALVLLVLTAPPVGVRAFAYLVIYLLIGGDILKKAVTNIFHGEIFDENFLMTIATMGAMAIGEYPEAVLVMLLYQIGEFLQDYAVDKSRKNIRELMDVRPDSARLLTEKGEEIVSPESVSVGDLVVVNPGEKVPLDGVVIEGAGYVDTSALTGESLPKMMQVEDQILSGCINKDSRLTIQVTKLFNQSTVSRILDLVENASSQKAPAEKFITKFARYYTPVVVGLAVLLVAVPVLFFQADFHEWLYRALTFLVISCPCALVISVPLSFFAGIGGASKAGILIKGSNYLEVLANTETVVFDKTGTLTKGEFAVEKIVTDLPQTELLKYAAAVEQYSTHPIAKSILSAYGDNVLPTTTEVKEIAGHGVAAMVNDKFVEAGNQKLFTGNKQVALPKVDEVGTIVYITIDGQYAGYLVIADQIKEDAQQAITTLKQNGVKETVMLTGDNQKTAAKVAERLGLSKFYSNLLPEDKVQHLQELISNTIGKVAFVGDGINDAPVLATADVGIAMGGLGSDAAIEAADVVIMDDKPSKITGAIKLSRKTLKIVRQNIVFALAVKAIVLVLGALGYASMGAAVFADVGVTLIAVLNALRCLRVEK